MVFQGTILELTFSQTFPRFNILWLFTGNFKGDSFVLKLHTQTKPLNSHVQVLL